MNGIGIKWTCLIKVLGIKESAEEYNYDGTNDKSHDSVIVVRIEILIYIELIFFKITKFGKVEDFTGSISNLTPEFIIHSGFGVSGTNVM